MTASQDRVILHASCVAVDGRGLLILGPSGSGKSALALHLMSLGAQLVADDRTEVFIQGSDIIATCPAAISGMIEARGVGILRANPLTQSKVVLAVDLGQAETHRLPPRRHVTILTKALELVLVSHSNHFPAALLCYLTGERLE